MHSETITHATLRELAEAGAIRETAAVGMGDRWSVVVKYGGIEKTLAGRNSRQVRSWANLNSVVKYLAGLGIHEFVTNSRNYDPQQKTHKRPDKSEALTRAHQAAEHDQWFREQVQAGIEEADSPDAVWFTQKEMKQHMENWLIEKYGPRHQD